MIFLLRSLLRTCCKANSNTLLTSVSLCLRASVICKPFLTQSRGDTKARRKKYFDFYKKAKRTNGSPLLSIY
jgi:hypothetical protein